MKNQKEKINYDINNLLINYSKEDFGELVYYYYVQKIKIKNKKISKYNLKEIKEIIYYKICNILPQDIIINLPERNIIKKKYYEQERYNNFIEYIKDLECNRKINKNNYKISIIYTFSKIDK